MGFSPRSLKLFEHKDIPLITIQEDKAKQAKDNSTDHASGCAIVVIYHICILILF